MFWNLFKKKKVKTDKVENKRIKFTKEEKDKIYKFNSDEKFLEFITKDYKKKPKIYY